MQEASMWTKSVCIMRKGFSWSSTVSEPCSSAVHGPHGPLVQQYCRSAGWRVDAPMSTTQARWLKNSALSRGRNSIRLSAASMSIMQVRTRRMQYLYMFVNIKFQVPMPGFDMTCTMFELHSWSNEDDTVSRCISNRSVSDSSLPWIFMFVHVEFEAKLFWNNKLIL